MADLDNELEMLHVGDEVVSMQTQVARAGGVSAKAIGALGLVLCAGLVWALTSSSPADVASDSGVDTATPEPASPTTPRTTLPTTPPTTPQTTETIPAPPGRFAPALPGIEDQGVPVLTPSGQLVGSDLVAASGGPLFPTSELSIIISRPTGETTILDLATGAVAEQRLLTGQLLGRFGDRFVFQDLVTGFVAIVDADDLEGQVDRVFAPASHPIALAAWESDAGTVTVLSQNLTTSVPTYATTVIDPGNGSVVATRPVETDRGVPIVFSTHAGNANVFSPPVGGVYLDVGDFREPRYEQVLDGRVLAADDTLALVHRCDAVMACALQWHDTTSWNAVDRPLPPEVFEIGALLGGGRVIAYIDPGDNSISVFDVGLDRTVPVELSRFGAVSPTGDLLSYFDEESGDLVIVELDELVETRVDVGVNSGHIAFLEP